MSMSCNVVFVGHQHQGIAGLGEAAEGPLISRRSRYRGPVARSQNNGGIVTSARATATRCRCRGKLVGLGGACVSQIHLGAAASAAFSKRFLLRHSTNNEGQFHVVQRAGARQQVEGLEDEADFLVANIGQFGPSESSLTSACSASRPRARSIQAADQVHQRGLAGARRSHDGPYSPRLIATKHR